MISKPQFRMLWCGLTLLAAISANLYAVAESPAEPAWPRVFTKSDREVIVYQPQLDEWIDYRQAKIRMAVAVTPGENQPTQYGVVAVSAPTKVNYETRMVLIDNPQIEYRFPNVPQSDAAALERIVRDVVPAKKSITVSLDRMLASVDHSAGGQREVQVSLDPPTILYSNKPAVLVLYMGQPEFKPVDGTSLSAAVNTNWDVFKDEKARTYYLRLDESWLKASDPVKGPWSAASMAPPDVKRLPNDDNWKEARAAYPGKALASLPAVYATTQPSELILTEGDPKYSPISGTSLMQVTNTESPLIYYPEETNYYYLVAGRWFRAKQLAGPWSAATPDLPATFASIPPDHKLGYVRASVPGTEEAADAVLLAGVPRTATVKKRGTTVTVTYEGEPKFELIPGTSVSYAVNSPFQVFRVQSDYYCCYQGVWFKADSAAGPWAVCASVPADIYSIPPSHPTHNVTYVYVYEEDEDDVDVYYTSGYTGEYVAGGLLLFGAGMLIADEILDDDDWWYYAHYHYYPHWYSYGCGAIYNPIYGGFYRGAHWYGPYGGAGRIGYYNPATGGWARGGYRYGPAGGAYAGAAYNPNTDVFRAKAGGSGIYGSWSRSYVQVGDEWVRGGTREGVRGSAGWVQTSGGGGAAAWDTARGQGAIVKGPGDNVFVGHDGNIYRRDPSGDWHQNTAGGWQNAEAVNRTAPAAAPARVPQRTVATQPAQTRVQTPSVRNQNVTGSRPTPTNVAAGLNRDAVARDIGNRSVSRAQTMSVPSGARGGVAAGGGAVRGGGGARGGGGRRR